ncbi:hypothetical protein VM1G_10363 [Cytospora mali]|uniref:Uncharacterized protein n=1 Tax=Cytospora mali TaxID=578113 RepID=A0A194VHJ9_CYTMA|nr:hypothetical protein VM1G_10363 [Valsa mali]
MLEDQRVLCPSCHWDLLQPGYGPSGDAFIYATLEQMREQRLTCDNFSCPVYIEGQPHLAGLATLGTEDIAPEAQHVHALNHPSDANDDDRNNHRPLTTDFDDDAVTATLANKQAVAGSKNDERFVEAHNQLHQQEVVGDSALYTNMVFAPVSDIMNPFRVTNPFAVGPSWSHFMGTTSNAIFSHGHGVSQGPIDTDDAVPVPVSNSPVNVPATLPNTSPNANPVPTGAAIAGPSRRSSSSQPQRSRASIRNRYTEHEIAIIIQMKAQGYGNDKIAQV